MRAVRMITCGYPVSGRIGFELGLATRTAEKNLLAVTGQSVRSIHIRNHAADRIVPGRRVLFVLVTRVCVHWPYRIHAAPWFHLKVRLDLPTIGRSRTKNVLGTGYEHQ